MIFSELVLLDRSSAMQRRYAQLSLVFPSGLVVSPKSFFENGFIKLCIRKQAFQAGVFVLNFFKTLRFFALHSSVIVPPSMVGGFANSEVLRSCREILA